MLIEDAMTGRALFQELRQDCISRRLSLPANTFIAIRPLLDKETRFDAQTAKIVKGRVRFPGKADWLTVLWEEFRAFPKGRHDDQVDSVAQFLEWMGSRPGEGATIQAGNGGIHRRPLRPIRRPPPPRLKMPRSLNRPGSEHGEDPDQL